MASICIGFSVYSTQVVGNTLTELLRQPDQFADFTALADLTKQNNNFIAVCVFLAWIKLFKYISFNKTMTQLSSTLSRVSKILKKNGPKMANLINITLRYPYLVVYLFFFSVLVTFWDLQSCFLLSFLHLLSWATFYLELRYVINPINQSYLQKISRLLL